MKICLRILVCCAVLLGQAKAQAVVEKAAIIYSTNPKQATVQTTADSFAVQKILVAGNRRTRRSTILRELDFRTGDAFSLQVMAEKLERARQQLMNTNLFRTVTVDLRALSDSQTAVHVQVDERWYFHPQLSVRIANGSFSQWNERGRPLSHLNYGVKLTQYNFSGRGDKASIHFGDGYTKKAGLQYQNFFFDKAMKWAGSINVQHGKNREINYQTQNNKLLAVKNPDGFLYEFTQGNFDVVYRPAINTRHSFSVGYSHNRVSDTVYRLNENFAPAENEYNYIHLTYGLSFTDFDFNPYPTKGRQGYVSLQKIGIGNPVNVWQLSAGGTNYWPIGGKGFFSVKVAGLIKLPFKQPYITQQFMGHGDAYLQGYENYFIDGVAGGYSKQTVGVNLLSTKLPLPKTKLFKSLHSVPLKIYAKAYTNEGYVHNPSPGYTNRLANRMLYSTGFGLDLLVFNDLLFKFEWSFNQLGQNGLFLHQ